VLRAAQTAPDRVAAHLERSAKMKTLTLFITLAAIALSACSNISRKQAIGSDKPTSNSLALVRNGLSFESAIIIEEKTEQSGVPAEYAWIDKHISHIGLGGQSLVDHDGKPYDIIQVKLPDGRVCDIFFDISNFFGKN